jgi:uncharacterized protein YciI
MIQCFILLGLTGVICASIQLATAATQASPSRSPVASSSPGHSANAPMEFDSFIVVLLVRAKNAPEMPKEELEKLQESHLANIRRLHGEGKLLKAGPFEDYSNRDVRGMFIPNTASVDQAREWVGTDPAVKAGSRPNISSGTSRKAVSSNLCSLLSASAQISAL